MKADLEVTRLESEGDNLRLQVVFVKVQASQTLGNKSQPWEQGLDGMKAGVEVTRRGRLLRHDPPTWSRKKAWARLTGLASRVIVGLPSQPVIPGDTWELDLSQKDQGLAASGKHVLDSIDSKSGVRVAKISGEMELQVAEWKSTGKGRSLAEVAVVGGYLISFERSVDFEQEENAPIAQSFKIHLQPPGALLDKQVQHSGAIA